jgi:hypothetical protein
MFERERPLFLRALSLFHVALLPVMLFLLLRLGYDPAAFPAMVLLGWAILLASFRLTDPASNINWVHRLGSRPAPASPALYLAALMVAYPLLVFFPAHVLLRIFFR